MANIGRYFDALQKVQAAETLLDEAKEELRAALVAFDEIPQGMYYVRRWQDGSFKNLAVSFALGEVHVQELREF